MLISAPVSWGEMLDKITILQIKTERMTDASKLANVKKELDELSATSEAALRMPESAKIIIDELKAVNEKLWVIEDDIRECERQKDFGSSFIELARAVYFTNDERARLKRRLNDMLGSAIVEEKSYAAY